MGSHHERKPSLNLADAVTSLISLRSRAENVLPSTALRQYVAQSFVFQRSTHSNFGKNEKIHPFGKDQPARTVTGVCPSVRSRVTTRRQKLL